MNKSYNDLVDEILNSPALPVNSIAMLNDLVDLLEDNKTNCLSDLEDTEKMKAKVILHVLTMQLYGQNYDLSSFDVYTKLQAEL